MSISKSDKLLLIKNYLKNNPSLKKFTYHNIFYSKYSALLKHHCEKNIVSVINNDNDQQLFQYTFPINKQLIDLTIYVEYIRELFLFTKKSENIFPKVELKYINNALYLEKFICEFTYYSEEDCHKTYENNDEIFVDPFPNIPLKYVIADGNHRISKQINSGIESFTARFVNCDICIKSMRNSFDAAIFMVLFDCALIEYNLGKVPDSQIKEKLFIFRNDLNDLLSHKHL